MRLGDTLIAFSLWLFCSVTWGQTAPTTARIETVPLQLTMPESFRVAIVLEPARRLSVIAAVDGAVRSLDVRLGATVRENQDLAQLDRSEANAKVKMALAEVKEKEGLV